MFLCARLYAELALSLLTIVMNNLSAAADEPLLPSVESGIVILFIIVVFGFVMDSGVGSFITPLLNFILSLKSKHEDDSQITEARNQYVGVSHQNTQGGIPNLDNSSRQSA